MAFGDKLLEAGVSRDQVDQLEAYATLLGKWNKKFNFVSRRDIERLESRHLLDSLSAAPHLYGARVLDVGSGAGLPGIPLAIACPESEFVLLDRHTRRVRFLAEVARSLGLTNVQPVCADLSKHDPVIVDQASGLAVPASFSTITSRAVATVPELWQLTGDFLASDGRLVVLAAKAAAAEQSNRGESASSDEVQDEEQKAREQKLEEALKLLPIGAHYRVEWTTVDGDSSAIVVVRRATPGP